MPADDKTFAYIHHSPLIWQDRMLLGF